MMPRTVLLFGCLILVLAISLSDGEKVRKKSTAKVQVKKVSGGKKGTTVAPLKAKGITKKKKKKTTPKSSLSQTNEVQETVIDEFGPDSEMGIDCFDSCYANSTFVDGAGKILNPTQYGKFRELCGNTYLFGSKKVTWAENWKTCCSIGMQPVLFDSLAAKDCMSSAVQNGREVQLEDDETFWLGGFYNQMHYMWSWCTRNYPEPIEEAIVRDFPEKFAIRDDKRVDMYSGDRNCLRVNYDNGGGVFNDDCAAKRNLMCQAKQIPAPDLLPDSKCRAKCSKSCTKTSMKSKLNEKQELELSERYKDGRWVSHSGRYFLISNKMATNEEARQKCCSMGANLLSIKTFAKRKSLAKVAKDYPDTVGEFWTSGSDAGCDGNFRWCSVDRAFLKKEVNWAPSEPDRNRGDCVSTKIISNPGLLYLSTDDCSVKKKFVCEVRQSGLTHEAIHKECASLLDLTQDEEASLKELDKYTYKMKCYLKCMGDNTRLLINSTLQTGNLMRMMEEFNVASEKPSAGDIKKCEMRRNKSDECKNAFLIFKCAKEQAPKMFDLVIKPEKTGQPAEE